MIDGRAGWRRAKNWRVTPASPMGMMMWFDPSREVPGTQITSPHDSEKNELADVGRGEQGTFEWGGGVSLEGGAANQSDANVSESSEDPPPGFLERLWEGD